MSKPNTPRSVPPREVSLAEMAEHEGLVRWVVSRQRLRGLPFEDAVQAGRIGLWQALGRYDPERGFKFSTYAVVAIKREVWQAVSEHQAPRPLGPDQPPSPLVQSVDPIASLAQAEIRAELARLVGTLPSRLLRVIVAHHGLDGSLPESFSALAQTLGVTRQRVQQLHLAALVYLGEPNRSRELRSLLDRQTRKDYQRALSRSHRWRRGRRAGRGTSR